MDPAPRTVTVVLAGDVMTGRGIDQVLRHPGAPALREPWLHDARDYVRAAERAHGPIGRALPDDAIWGPALDWLQACRPDLLLLNLETAVTDRGTPAPDRHIHYRMHPDNLGCLAALGRPVWSLANNHVLDWGPEGLAQTLARLHGAGLRSAGAGADADAAWAPAFADTPAGARLAVVACAVASSGVPAQAAAGAGRPGIAWLPDLSDASAQRVARAAAAARSAGAAAVVLSIHWGDNWPPAVPEAHRRFAHRLVDAGAVDLVHGHSAHGALPIEVHRDRALLYGCGDLVNDYEGIDGLPRPLGDLAQLAALTLDAASACVQAVELLPLQRQRFRLQAADDAVFDAARRAAGAAGLRWRVETTAAVPGLRVLRWTRPGAAPADRSSAGPD